MKSIRWTWAVAVAVLAVPLSAGAYSFKPSFDPGEQILSITLDSEAGDQASFDTVTNTLTFQLPVSTINTTVESISVADASVFLEFGLQLDLASLSALGPGALETSSASFDAIGLAQLIDAADGNNLLWEASWDAAAIFSSITNFSITQGGLSGNLSEVGGSADAAFLAAIGDSVAFTTNFVFTANTCGGIVDSCPFPADMVDWTAQANTTLTASVPEPTSVLMLGLGLLALGARRRVA